LELEVKFLKREIQELNEHHDQEKQYLLKKTNDAVIS
jgi:hypothetical protein